MKKTLLTIASAALLSTSVQAEQYWADTSLSLLQGSDYEFIDDDVTTLTVEHVSGHSWGGLFLFSDRLVSGDFKETYSEVSPKFTLMKMDGFVSNINAAFTYENSSNSTGFSQDNYLYGVGADLNVPGLNFASATLYYAANKSTFGSNNDMQITLTYGYSMGEFNIDGFVDYSFENSEDNGFVNVDNIHINPQITYNVGPLLGTANKIKVGIEYSYWDNQFGVDGQDQSAVSLLLKTHL
ncbi:MAG: hypothetical protein JXR16_02365 [Bermanella sp.]